MNLEGLPYTLDRMRIDDVPSVSAIERMVFTLPWSSTAFSYELRNNDASEYHVLRYAPWVGESWERRLLPRGVRRFIGSAKNDLSLLGYGGFWMMLEEAHICTLALRPEWRGRGLGELVLAALIERALARGSEVITLEVRVSNIKAQNLYQKYGFAIVGRRQRYYSDNGEDALIMNTDVVTAPGYQQLLVERTRLLRERLLGQLNLPPTTLATESSS